MKTNHLILLLLAMGLSNFGCKEDGLQVTAHLQLIYDQEPLIMNQKYTYPDGKAIILTRVSAYISDLAVHDQDQTKTLEDVRFINFSESHKNRENASEGYLLLDEELDLKALDRISFNIGLTPAQNKTLPADHPSGNPLANTGEHWLAWNSYIFFKIEGYIDLDEDDEPETGVALHLGSDEVMRAFDLQNNTGTNDVMIQIDLNKIFGTNPVYDIVANPQIHSLSQLPAILELAQNLGTSVEIQSGL